MTVLSAALSTAKSGAQSAVQSAAQSAVQGVAESAVPSALQSAAGLATSSMSPPLASPGASSAASSLLQAVLAALGPGQNQRLLRLNTPLGPDVLLAERVQGVEVVGPRAGGQAPAGFRFEILALSTNAHLQLKDLMGQPVRLDLLTQQSRVDLRPFHGHVTAFALLGSDGGLARYKLTVEPWLAFLGHRQDAWVFQDQTVMQIVDEVFADYQGQGRLVPAWRWDLADPTAYPRRSLCVQYHETDLAFVQRLLAEEGLFCWFEHAGEGADQGGEGHALGAHTLVIADHNGGFQPSRQPLVRYTQSGSASFREDSLSRFDEVRRVAASSLAAASWDHRSVQQSSAQAGGDARLSAEGLALALRDQPGAYAYEDSRQAQRVVQRHLEALQAPAHQCRGQGSLRQAACATTFQVAEHPSVPVATRWVTLAVQHRARNNITAELATSLRDLLGALPPSFAAAAGGDAGADAAAPARAPKPSLFKGPVNQTEEPLYQAVLLTQDAAVPVRAPSGSREQGDIVFTRPQVPGVQTAIVVGLAEPVHTDRDNRIKVQFHWQRGNSSAHRLAHPAGSNAPGDQSAGTWVRVSQAWSGANWGGHFTPRLGQEVLVSFVEGDIDRPVVIGSAYNGQGGADAQGNQVAAGAATATGDAGPWFPGTRKAGELEGHQHTQVLAGFKSQSLEASQSGSGGYNQLVFDDTPAQARAVVGTTKAATWLQLGHLLEQNDNQRLARRGHGLDLATEGHGALRAGAGLHLSTYARPLGTQAGAQSIEARDAMSLVEQAGELMRSLSDTAQKHNARLSGEAQDAEGLPAFQALRQSTESLVQTASVSARAEPSAADAGAASSAGEASQQPETFDEQVRFLDAAGSPLAGMRYSLTLANGDVLSGVTDPEGCCQRVVTRSPQEIKEARIGGGAVACCAAPEGGGDEHAVVVPMSGVSTHAGDPGVSVVDQQVKADVRPLTAGEIAMARTVFKDSIDYTRVKVHNGSYLPFSGQNAMTPNGEMYFPGDYFRDDYSAATDAYKLWFMHEMVHVWQYQLGYWLRWNGFKIMVQGGYSDDGAEDQELPAYRYAADAAGTRKLSDFNMEQQGEIISHYYAATVLGMSRYEAKLPFLSIVLEDFLRNPKDEALLPQTAHVGN